MYCYCSICRKTGGGGGYMINIGGDANTLEVEGEQHLRKYRAMIEHDGAQIHSGHARYFCGECGTHLYAIHDKWPDLVHPVAACIDTPLPKPPARVHMMLSSKAGWIEPAVGENDEQHDEYPRRSLADWHKHHGYTE